MVWYRNMRMVGKIVIPVAMMLIVALGVLTWQIQSKSSAAIHAVAQRELAALAGEYGNDVKSFFNSPMEQAEAMAAATTSALEQKQSITRELYNSMLRGVERSNDNFFAAGAAFEPNAFGGSDSDFIGVPGSDPSGRYMPYSAVGTPVVPLEDLESSAYYAEPKKRNKGFLTDPYKYNVNGNDVLMTTASAVVKLNGQFRGIALVDTDLTTIAKRVSEVKVYESGYAAVLTQTGAIVAHKDTSRVGKNVFDTAQVENKADLRSSMDRGESFLGEHSNEGKPTFYYYYPIYFERTGQTWYFCVAAPLGEVLADANMISRLTITISSIVLLLALLVVFFVVRSSVKPLGILAGVAQEIAGGNLHVAIRDESFGGEVKTLSTALKDMITSLLQNITKAEELSIDAKAQTEKALQATREAEAMRIAAENAKREGMLDAADRLEGVVSIISSASKQLSTQIDESEKGSKEQAARLGETATAMEEMNSTVLEVARNASAASDASAQTKARAQEGAGIVQEAVTGIQNVQAVSMLLKEDMSQLAKQADSISEIMGVISDIADQTNLLALNAAIEAARAGEAGRGFAVVADEVRKLAEKTMTSTTDVGRTVGSIQKSVSQSIAQVDRAVTLIATTTTQSSKSGEALGSIVAMVDDTADQVRAIAAASEEQSATSEEINRSIGHINDISVQTAQTMQEAAKAVSNLAGQAHTLSQLIDEMKKA